MQREKFLRKGELHNLIWMLCGKPSHTYSCNGLCVGVWVWRGGGMCTGRKRQQDLVACADEGGYSYTRTRDAKVVYLNEGICHRR